MKKIIGLFKKLSLLFLGSLAFAPFVAFAATTIGTNISTDGYLKIGTAIPGAPVNGMLYYDSGTNKFKCYENGSWSDCITNVSTWAGSGNITTVGTLTSGSTGAGFTIDLGTSTVSGVLSETNGGTGQSSYTAGDILYSSAVNTLSPLGVGSNGDILTVVGGVPSWQSSTPLIITDTFVYANLSGGGAGTNCIDEATAETGDVCIVTSTSKSYICQNATCTLVGDWVELIATSSLNLTVANNLSDVGNVATSLTNLGLGTGNTPTFSGLVLSNYLDFNTAVIPASSPGRLFYDSVQESLSYYTDIPGLEVNIGQRTMIRVANITGSSIPANSIIHITGATAAGIPTVDLARANTAATSKALGIASKTIASGSEGFATTFGMIYDANTSSYSAGDPIYLSPTTPGAFTATRPVQPNYEVPVGFIGKSDATTGTILIYMGTKVATAVNQGEVVFGSSTGYLVGDSSNLFWDETNKRLGIGTNTPAYALDINNSIKADTGIFYLSANNGAPAGAVNGAMYYDTSSDIFKCYENSAWKDCDTSAAIVADSLDFTDFSDTMAVDAITTIDLGANNLSITSAGAGILTLTSGGAATWGTGAGNLNLAVNGAATGNVQIGTGAGATTPDFLVLDLKSDAEGALAGTNGAMYYNSNSNKFRCYENGGWTNCVASTGSAVLSSITAAVASNSINNGDNTQTWNWNKTTSSSAGITFGENTASTGTGTTIVNISTLASSTAMPLTINNAGDNNSFRVNDTSPGDTTPFIINNDGNVAVGATSFDPTNPEKLKVDAGTTTSINVISGYGSIDNYLQLNIQNRNSGGSASSDLVATADNGDENVYYLDMGINSSGYNDPGYTIGGPNDAYILAQGGLGAGGNLSIGTGTAGTAIKFYTGGSLAANEKMRIEDATGNVGIGTTTVNATLDLAPATADALRIEPYGAAAGNTGNLELMELAANGSNYVGFKAPDAIGVANPIWTLPAADGTSGQVLSTDGSSGLSWVSGATSYWQRVGTILSPSTSGDAVTSNGLLTGQLGLTVTGAAVSLNDNSNFNTTINTGSSSGTVTIGSVNAGAVGITSGTGAALTLTGGAASSLSTTAGDITLQAAGSGTANVQIGTGGAGSTTPDLFILDVKSDTGDPATAQDGAIYYNEFEEKFKCHVNGSWSDCDTTGGTPTLQLAYNGGATINTAGSNIAFTLNTTDQFTASGTGSVNLTPTGASSFTSGAALTLTGGATSTWSTSSGALTITSATAATWGTGAGDLTLQAAGAGTTGKVHIGSGAASANPDLLSLDILALANPEPAGSNGDMYYSNVTNTFRCHEAGGWKDCGATAASATTLQQAYTSGPTIATTAAKDFALTLNATGNFTASGAGSVNLTPTGASSFTSGAALTLTGGATSTWSVTGAGNDLNIDAADVLNLGTTNATGITIGKSGVTTTNIGTLQTGNAATAGNFKIADGSTNFVTLTSSAIVSDYTLTLPVDDGTSGQALITDGSGNLSWTAITGNLMTTEGDMLYRDGTGNARLPRGTNGQILQSSATTVGWVTPTGATVGLGNVTNDAQLKQAIGTAKGDLITYTASNTPTQLPIGGTNGFVLMVDATQATGMKWAANTPANNSLDFLQFSNAMTVDANTSINLNNKSLTINDTLGGGAGTLSMSTNGAALTLTAGAASTWSTTAGDLTINSGTTTPAGLNLGTAGTNAVAIGNGSSTFALTSSGGLNVTIGGALTGVSSIDTISTSATALTFAGAGTIAPGGANTLTLGSVNTTSTTNIQSGTGNINLLPASTGIVTIGTSDTVGTSLVLDVKTNAGNPSGTNGAMYYNSNEGKFKCYENSAWKDCDTAGTSSLQTSYNSGATITTSGGNAITFTTPISSNNAGLVINQNNTTNNPVALQITNAGTGNDITATNWSVTKNGVISTSGNINATGTGAITSAGTLTALNGLTMSTGALSLTSTSGSISSTGLTGLTLTLASGTGAIAAPALNLNTSGTGNTAIGNATGTFALTSSGGFNVTTGGVMTGSTWQGTAIGATYGGTAQTTYATGDMLYASAINTLGKLTVGTNGQCLTSNGTIPTWGSCGSSAGTDTDSTLRWNGSSWVENTAVEITTTGDIKMEGQGDTQWYDSDSSNYVAFQSPAAVTSNVTWTLPSADGTANKVLTTNGSGTLSWGNSVNQGSAVIKNKTALETDATGVLQNDDHLFFSIGANETWVVTFNLSFTSAGARDIQVAVSAPAGASCNMGAMIYRNNASVSNIGCGVTSGQLATAGGAEPGTVVATIVNGGTAGTVGLQWAQWSAGAASTMYANASMVASKVN